jgi:predicted nuclease with RNAse H fold
MTVVAGIDLTAGRGTCRGTAAIARLTLKARDRPRLAADAYVAVVTDDDIIAALWAYHPAVVAIDAPLALPAPVASALSGKDAMVAKSSPYTRAAERDPIWTELGIRPLPVSFLGGLTFRAICLVARLRDALPASAIIEAFPNRSVSKRSACKPWITCRCAGRPTSGQDDRSCPAGTSA